MFIGVVRCELRVGGSTSLKDKRRTVRSLCDRLRQRFNVAVAEVDGHGSHQRATLAVVCVSADSGHAREMLSCIQRWLEASAGEDLAWCDAQLL